MSIHTGANNKTFILEAKDMAQQFRLLMTLALGLVPYTHIVVHNHL